MSKILVIVRHGKSDWSMDNLKDYDRPLKNRGYADGYKMAKKLSSFPSGPEMFCTSPANRALYTCMIFSRVITGDFKTIQIWDDLYLASAETLLKMIKKTDNSLTSIALFGHNPGVTDLSNYFLPWSIGNLPTSGFVRLEFDIKSWSKIHKDYLINQNFSYPKQET